MDKKVIAITGGIGSGKTFALNALKSAGYETFSCDEIIAKMYKKRAVKKSVKKIFPSAVKGKVILKVDKKEIAEQAFRDGDKLKALNGFFHPLVLKKISGLAKKSKKQPVFAEVPLLFEANAQKDFDGVMVIIRDKKERIAAVKKRSGLSEEEIIARMNGQIDYDGRDFAGCAVIKNDGDEKNFLTAVVASAKNFER